MRLPWPFNRADDRPDTGATEAAASASEVDAAGPASAGDRTAPPTGAWTSLPPIQRSVGAPPLVAPAAPFLDAVPGARPLPPIVEPLGHNVTPAAPAGIVAAPVHAVPALTSHAALVPRPVQRRGDSAAVDAGEPATERVHDAGSDATAPAATADPVRRLGVVPAAAAARPPDRPLTRVEPGPTGPSSSGSPYLARPTSTPASSTAADVVSGVVASAPASAFGPVVARSPVAPLGGGRARRPGLGAPIAAPPSGAVPIAADPPAHRPPVVAWNATGAATSSGPAASAGGTTARGFRATAGATPLLRPAQRRTTAGPEPEGEPPAATSLAAAGAPGAVPGASLPVLRVVRPGDAAIGARPAADGGPSVGPPGPGGSTSGPGAGKPALQRSGSTAAAPAVARPVRRPLVGSRPPLADAVQRTHDGVQPATRAGTDGDGLVMAGHGLDAPARSWDDAVRPTPGPPTALLGAAPFGVQRSSTAPRSHDGSPPTLARPRAVAAATPAPSHAAAPPAAGPSPLGIVAGPPSAPVVQALAQGTPVFAPTATPIVQRIDGAAPDAPAESDGHSESDLDDLARKLFGRFQNRLRAELIYEREAKGLTFDN